MRIVHVTHRTWPVEGGSERYVFEIARRQASEGHDVAIVATTADALSALWSASGQTVTPQVPEVIAGVRLLRLTPRYLPCGLLAFPILRRLTRALAPLFPDAAMSLGRLAPWLPQLPQVLEDLDPEFLFAWNITLESLTSAVADYSAMHGTPWIAVPLLHLARPYYTMRHQLGLLRAAPGVLAQTEVERTFLVRAGLVPSRVHVVSPGIDSADSVDASGERFRAARKIGNSPLVVTIGALGYEKGTLHLLDAVRRLWNDGFPLELALVGRLSGPVKLALRALSHRQRQHCHVVLRASEPEKWDILAAADVVSLPSRTESFGLVYLEAWLLGKPVIGARSGAAESVIKDGVDGLLVAFGDANALARAIRTLVEQPKVAAEMGAQGRAKVVSSYTWASQYVRLQRVVRELSVESES